MSARIPADVSLRRTDDASGWRVLRVRFDAAGPVVIGTVVKVAGAFRAEVPSGQAVEGPHGGLWTTRAAALAALRATDVRACGG